MLRATFKGVAVTLLSLVALTNASDSAAVGFRCDFCSTPQVEQQMQLAGFGEHEVYSFAEGTVRAFQVDIEPGLISIVELPPSTEALQAAAGFKEMFDQSGGSMKAAGTVNASDLGAPFHDPSTSAFTVIQNANLRAQLGDRLADRNQPLAGLSANVNGVRSLVESLINLSSSPTLNLTVVFPDGTTMRFEVDLISELATMVPGSGRTADGQLIPETAGQGDTGTWTGSVADVITMGQHMENRGALVRFNNACQFGQGPKVLCVWDNPNNQLHCKVFYPCQ